MIIDGRAIAQNILAETKEALSTLGRTPLVRVIVLQPTAVTESYLRIKEAKAREAGMTFEIMRLPDDADEAVARNAAADPAPDAIIVQLPLPSHFNERTVLDAIPVEKDADVLSLAAYAKFQAGAPGAIMPPVAAAVAEILARAHVHPKDMRAVVVGYGRLVGQPVKTWLESCGASVHVCTRSSGDLAEPLKGADIIVSGAGSPHLIQPHMIKEGAVLIDAGTSESGGAIVGDFDLACAAVASVFTPVPGGVGPVSVACLFKNVAALLNRE